MICEDCPNDANERGMFMQKKFKGLSVSSIGPLAMTLVVAAIIMAFGGKILADIQADQTANSIAYNVTGKGLTAMTTFGNWIPTIATIVAAVVVIGLLLVYFKSRA